MESGSTAATPDADVDVLISAGTPTSLTLSAGAYWFGWQYDATTNGPSYASGNAGVGIHAAQAYGASPYAFPNPVGTDYTSATDFGM